MGKWYTDYITECYIIYPQINGYDPLLFMVWVFAKIRKKHASHGSLNCYSGDITRYKLQ